MKAIIPLVVAAVAGIAMAIQGSFNTVAGKVIGMMENNLVVHAVGLITISVLLFIFGVGKGDFSKITDIPWYGYLGGVLSGVIIFAVTYSMSNIGVGNATAMIVLAQVATALIIDSTGLFGISKIDFNIYRGLGLVLLVIGTKLCLQK